MYEWNALAIVERGDTVFGCLGGVKMSYRSASIVAIVLGALILLFSVVADVIGVGANLGFGPRQLTGAGVGLILALAGYLVYRLETR